MKSKILPRGNFLSTYLLPIINVILLSLTLYVAIYRILFWNFLQTYINSRIQRLPAVIQIPQLKILEGQDPIIIWTSMLLPVVFIVMLLLFNKSVRRREFWLAAIPILGILIVTYLSRFWSVDRSYSVIRYLGLAAAGAGGIYFGFQYQKTKLMQLLEVFAALMIIGSLFVVYRYPHYGIMTGGNLEGAWRGIFWWKTYLGEITVFAATLFLLRVANFKNERWFARIYSFLFYGLAIFLLIKSNSATEIIAALAGHALIFLAILYLKWGQQLKPVHWWILGAASVMALVALWFGRDVILGVIGRNSELTGRIPVWEALIPYIKQRLFAGYGFGDAFWKNDAYGHKLWDVVGWRPPFAHNGYIEALLDTGILGLVLWVIFLIQTAFLSVRYFLRERNLPALIFIAWVVEVMVANLSDNQLGSYEDFTWLLLVLAFACTLRYMLDYKQSARVTTPKL